MVLQKRLHYGFNGYQVPATPRATRSARRSSYRKKDQGNQQCAFDLLATVAGKLLLEGECLPTAGKTSTGKDQCDIYENTAIIKQKDERNPQKIKRCDQRSCSTSFRGSDGSQAHNQYNSAQEFICTQNNAFSGLGSIITSDCSERVGCAEKLVVGKSKSEIGSSVKKEEVGLSGLGESNYLNLEDEANKHANAEPLSIGKGLVSRGVDQCSAEDPVVLNGKSPALVSSDSSAEMSPCRNRIPCGSFPVRREDVKLGSRDDDENSSGCTQPRTATNTFRQPSRIVDRRLRKILASKYWKLHPTSRNGNLPSVDAGLKPVYCNTKTCYKRQRSQRIYPFKKRKLYDCSSALNSDGGTSSEGIYSFPRKGIHGDVSGSHAAEPGATGASSSVGGQHSSCQSRDSHVKLRIKSFRVPELFIDIPETATVGSLKRTVMEAVTSILGSGLRIGVLLRGKKVRDDSKTLLQAGISNDNKLDALGFALEHKPLQAPTSPDPKGHPSPLPRDAPQPLTRYPSTAPVLQQGSCDPSPVANLDHFVESDHDSAPSPTDMSIDKSMADSQALIPAASVEALAVVPMHRKSKRSEIVQRRIRRPFSVSEVEYLVEAVEKLGTGRWRDVKLRAFDNAKHRTYVDLKDKWKTLVHTARISPQQRRGEPVPQELLDRVLTAHSYWSHQQTKHQQLKQQKSLPPPSESFLLL